MCGILFSLFSAPLALHDDHDIVTQIDRAEHPHEPVWIKNVYNEVEKRGPDYHSTTRFSLHSPSYVAEQDQQKGAEKKRRWVMELTSSVLHLRGLELQSQPIQDFQGNILLFNGEIYQYGNNSESVQELNGDLERNNDALILSRLLSLHADSEKGLLNVFGNIKGEWAVVYYVAEQNTLYFGRDFLGRRSLVYSSCLSFDDNVQFVLTSVTDGSLRDKRDGNWIEVPCTGLYKLDLNEISLNEPKNIAHCLIELSWGDVIEYPVNQIKLNMHQVVPERDLSSLDQVNLSNLPSKLTAQQVQARDTLLSVLSRSVWRRVHSIPSYHIQKTLDSDHNLKSAKLAILFSGGLDCMVLAAIASQHVHQDEPIDLLNVSFENPRSLKATLQKKVLKESGTKGSYRSTYLTPDRKTGIEGFTELCRLFPSRTWRFVQVNVEYEEAMRWKEYIVQLMHPLETVMDLSIAMAFWFASRGEGYLFDDEMDKNDHVENGNQDIEWRGVAYKSTARVLLSGLGADEQLGGYSRHRKAFEKGGWDELAKEISLDVGRISHRNLGRDDRIISSHGKEVRFPFLDENVYEFLSSLPVHIKTDPRFDRAVGDKMLLRLVARELGLDRAAMEAKRAVQFGARTAKMEISNQKGHELL